MLNRFNTNKEIIEDSSIDMVRDDGKFVTRTTRIVDVVRDISSEIAEKDTVIAQAETEKRDLLSKKVDLGIQDVKVIKP